MSLQTQATHYRRGLGPHVEKNIYSQDSDFKIRTQINTHFSHVPLIQILFSYVALILFCTGLRGSLDLWVWAQ